MLAPDERERLLGAMVGVYAQPATAPGDANRPKEKGKSPGDAFAGALDNAEEELLAALRLALERIAQAVSGPAIESATATALDGAELTTRAVLMAGRPDRLAGLLPSFAYLVTLPSLGEPEAARQAQRVRAVVEEMSG